MTFYEKKLADIRKTTFSNQRQIDSVIGIRKYIDDNYRNNLNLDVLSRTKFISKFHLLRLFKKYYGITPRQYLISKRIEQSMKLLKAGKTVSETCFAVGFQSLGSFSTLFKTKTGKAPIEYQKEQLSRSKKASDTSNCNLKT